MNLDCKNRYENSCVFLELLRNVKTRYSHGLNAKIDGTPSRRIFQCSTSCGTFWNFDTQIRLMLRTNMRTNVPIVAAHML